MLVVKAMICTKMMMTSLAHGVMKSMHTMSCMQKCNLCSQENNMYKVDWNKSAIFGVVLAIVFMSHSFVSIFM